MRKQALLTLTQLLLSGGIVVLVISGMSDNPGGSLTIFAFVKITGAAAAFIMIWSAERIRGYYWPLLMVRYNVGSRLGSYTPPPVYHYQPRILRFNPPLPPVRR